MWDCKRWSVHCTVVHTGHLQQLLSQQQGWRTALPQALSRQLWADSLHISVMAQVGCCSPDLLFLWFPCPFQVLLSVRVGAWVILSFSSGLRTLVLWNFLYVEMRLCTHAHMCTLRVDPGRKEEGRGDGEQERLMGKKKKCCIHCYIWRCLTYIWHESRRGGLWEERGKSKGEWEGQVSGYHDVHVRECRKKSDLKWRHCTTYV